MTPNLRKEMRLIFSLIYLVHFGPFLSICSNSAHFGLSYDQSIRSTSVYFVHFNLFRPFGLLQPIGSISIQFGPLCSISIHFSLFSPLWSNTVHFVPFPSIWCTSVPLVQFGSFELLWSI